MSRFVKQVLHLLALSVQRTPFRTPTAWLATSRELRQESREQRHNGDRSPSRPHRMGEVSALDARRSTLDSHRELPELPGGEVSERLGSLVEVVGAATGTRMAPR